MDSLSHFVRSYDRKKDNGIFFFFGIRFVEYLVCDLKNIWCAT